MLFLNIASEVHDYIQKVKGKGYLSDLSGFAFYNSGFGYFFPTSSASPWLPLSPDCPRPGGECGCSAFIICPGQWNVPSDAPPWLAVAPYFHFHQGTAIHQLPLETLFQTFLQDKCHFHNWPLDSSLFFMLHYPSFVFFSFISTVKRFHFHCFAFLFMQSDCILFALM